MFLDESNQTVRLISIHSFRFPDFWSAVVSVAFSPNGKLLASVSGDGSVQLWAVEDGDGSCLVNLLEHHESAAKVALSPDGQTLASNGSDETVRLWNPHEED